MSFVLGIIWNWIKDAQFHKTAASAAAGTSIGLLTVMTLVDQRIDTAKAELAGKLYSLSSELRVSDQSVVIRKEVIDQRFEIIDQNLKYLRGAIDATNQNILLLSREIKRN